MQTGPAIRLDQSMVERTSLAGNVPGWLLECLTLIVEHGRVLEAVKKPSPQPPPHRYLY
jgi:hypothetical protein